VTEFVARARILLGTLQLVCAIHHKVEFQPELATAQGISPRPLTSAKKEDQVRMELGSICLYLHQTGMSGIDIHKDIEAIIGPDAIGQSTLTKYIRETQATHDSEPTPTSIEDECQRFLTRQFSWRLPRSLLLPFGEWLEDADSKNDSQP
jgi:hypothetical protein